MCGRFTLTLGAREVALRFSCESGLTMFQPRYNAAPGQMLPVIIDKQIKLMRWGLIPSWANNPSIGNKMINARSETVAEKPSFKNLFRSRRCIIPADGYYEWQKVGKLKIPMRIVLKSRDIFGLAGLWDLWQNPNGDPLYTFTILTTEPVNSVQDIHNRMPIILQPDNEQFWLNSTINSPADTDFLRSLLKPVEELESYRVSTLVNTPSNETSECILPI